MHLSLPVQDERLHDLLDRLQGKFKAVASTIGSLHDYLPKEQGGASAAHGMTY